MAQIITLGGDETSFLALQEVLRPFGHELTATTSRTTLLEALRAGPFDLVLVDIEGEVDPDLVPSLVATPQARRVVAVTAYPKAPSSVRALAEGAHSLMGKPFEIRRILELLGESLP